MKILLLTRYPRNGASSRMRFYQYEPFLRAAGMEVEISPLFTEEYVSELQQGRRHAKEYLPRYIARAFDLIGARNFDVIWIEKEALPWLPGLVEQALLPAGIPYVLDYDDAVFHAYDLHERRLVRMLLGEKHRHLMRRSALVIAGNSYLADYACSAGAPRIEVVPTAVDIDRYGPAVRQPGAEKVQVGWIGQRSTAHFLQPLGPLFRRLAFRENVEFAAIGIEAEAQGLPMRSTRWTEETEARSIGAFDVGIMPLVDGPFERGKCGYKLIQYMASGLPVIASPVGVNCDIVEHGVNGFLAKTEAEWETALIALIRDPKLRARMGQAGRRKVEQRYTLDRTVPHLVDLLRSVRNKSES